MVLTQQPAPRPQPVPRPRHRRRVRVAVVALLATLIAVGITPTMGTGPGPLGDAVPVAAAAPAASTTPTAPATGGGSSASCAIGGAIGALAGGALGGLLGCKAGTSSAGAIKDAAGSGFAQVAKSMAQGWLKIITMCLAWFVKIPTPQWGSSSVIADIQRATLQIQMYGLVLSIMIGGFRLIMARRNAAMGVAQESFMALAKTVFGAWMFGGVLTAATAASDALASWMLSQAQSQTDATQLLKNLASVELLGLNSAGLVFVFAVIGILGGILQAVLLVSRQAMLAVVVTAIPIAGAFGGTQIGRGAFQKMMSWTIALLLWKPVAALVYWVAFRLAAAGVKDSKDAQMALYGLILLSLSAAVLPMLVRLVSGGAAMAAGSGLQATMMTAGVVAAAGTMAATGGGAMIGAGSASAGAAQAGATTMPSPASGPAGRGTGAPGASGSSGTGSAGGPGPRGTGGGGGGGTGGGRHSSTARSTPPAGAASAMPTRGGGGGARGGSAAGGMASAAAGVVSGLSREAEAFYDNDRSVEPAMSAPAGRYAR